MSLAVIAHVQIWPSTSLFFVLLHGTPHVEKDSVPPWCSFWAGLALDWTIAYGKRDALPVLDLAAKSTGTSCFLPPGVLSCYVQALLLSRGACLKHWDTRCVSDDHSGCLAQLSFRWLQFQPLPYCSHVKGLKWEPPSRAQQTHMKYKVCNHME